jgi:hypothetical protein
MDTKILPVLGILLIQKFLKTRYDSLTMLGVSYVNRCITGFQPYLTIWMWELTVAFEIRQMKRADLYYVNWDLVLSEH